MRVRVSSPFSPAPPVVPLPFSAAAAAEGDPGSGGRLVNRVRWRLVGGGVCVGAASLRMAVLSRRIWPPLVGAWCSDDGSVRVLPQGWRGGDVILVVVLYPRALQHRSGAREVVHWHVQTTVCISGSWKMLNPMLGLWLEASRFGFLLRRCRRAGC